MPQKLIDSFAGNYGFLSNFYPCVIAHQGMKFPTSEHAFQWSKTFEHQEKHRVLWTDAGIATTPGQSKQRGRRVTLRPDWEAVKVQVMTEILLAKFTQHAPLLEKLFLTEDACLVEGNLWHDRYWGVCYCTRCKRQGENMLGQILMQLRQELSNG
jgi:ribA/ribD-fused uncharacterized protein